MSGFRSHYVVIGGMATVLTLEERNLPARATKDVDMIIICQPIETRGTDSAEGGGIYGEPATERGWHEGGPEGYRQAQKGCVQTGIRV